VSIVEQPKFGTLSFDPGKPFTFFYTSNVTDLKSTVVDKVVISYKDVRGVSRLVTREFVLQQKGDVPRIIRTGNQPARCKNVKPTGTTVGRITVGAVSLPIKAFNYPAGGIMEPQKTVLSAGVSQRHMPLSSNIGTSVITWHKNYNGCWNFLNVLVAQKVGSTFDVTDENGDTKKYRIDKKLVVKNGDYKDSWFTLVGPRQLALFTCTGRFEKGHYSQNWVLIATPVN
jgi:hypothetical protein